MLFNSLPYLIFFPLVVIAYFIIPHRYRWFLLLTSSLYFYMAWRPEYILLVVISVSVDYIASLMMGKTEDKRRRKKYLAVSLCLNLLILGFFKYFNFFNGQFAALFQWFDLPYSVPRNPLALPLGISFYTFQAMSYAIDVYRGAIKPEKNFFIYFLYIMFFPQLVAGPIERAGHLLHQFRVPHTFDYQRVTDGIKLIMWGLFKKVVIADRAAVFVETVYNSPTDFSGVSLIMATIFFSFQIYCDFSGYSDIAIGSAQVLGFDLMDNFKRPYFSKSIAEFWQRWHISLSTWFKDYVYIPLGGNRVSKLKWYKNIFVTFLVSGLWHGANWTFIVWGALHGIYIIIGDLTKTIRSRFTIFIHLKKLPVIHKYLAVLSTFFLVNVGWIFFRAKTVADAWYILTHLGSGLGDYLLNIPQTGLLTNDLMVGQSKERFLVTIAAIGIMEAVHLSQRHGTIRHMLTTKPLYLRWSIYLLLFWMIIFFGKFGERQFIYFVF